MGWDREAINDFLANGGDIKEVDRFLRAGGQITQPAPEIVPGDPGADCKFGDDFPLEPDYFQYLEGASADEKRLSVWYGGSLEDDYSEESFP